MYANLKGTINDLPPSQVIRAIPRGSNAYDVSDAGTELLPDIESTPESGHQITFSGGVLSIPK
jgi:hypothetical protein